jgi:hypothetical protein
MDRNRPCPEWGYPHFLLSETDEIASIYRESAKGDFESGHWGFLFRNGNDASDTAMTVCEQLMTNV